MPHCAAQSICSRIRAASEVGESAPKGWYQIELKAFAVLQGAALMLILLLAWPSRSGRESILRLAYGPPALPVLVLIHARVQLLGNLQWAAYGHLDRQHQPLLYSWDEFLQGGGTMVRAIAAAATAVAAGAGGRTAARPAVPAGRGCA